MSKRRPAPPRPVPAPQVASSRRALVAGGVALGAAALAAYLVWRPGPSAAPPPEAAAARPRPAGDANYVDASACAGCHAEIAASYAESGMARSFYPANRETMAHLGEAREFRHAKSGDVFAVVEREGRYFVRRWREGEGGAAIEEIEREIHFVMGSGNHARTYLHRHPNGKIVELPLGWYADKGGFLAMNPGFDQPRHRGFRREIGFDCMGCHNGYPPIEPGADAAGRDPLFAGVLPAGIDCQRCHGPGRPHLEAAANGKPAAEVRAAIFNPAKAEPARQIEVCLQCHLESTSRRLPYAVRQAGRGAFSFRPGEPLADFVLHFDHPLGVREDKFEIAHHGYQLLRSECFRRSEALTCTTCHDAHGSPRSPGAAVRFDAACRGCHPGEHPTLGAAGRPAVGCASCHMPKRRTDDVVHVVMTDHRIRRRPAPAERLLAPREEVAEAEGDLYRGEVVLFYPAAPRSAADELHVAVAQVVEGTNLAAGTPRLERLLEEQRPPEAAPYHHLAEAYWQAGQPEQAEPWWRAALERDPGHLAARRNLALALGRLGRPAEAETELRRALADAPDDPIALTNLADLLTAQGREAEAEAALERALRADPDSPEALHNLARARARLGDAEGALTALRQALAVEPRFPAARNTLARLHQEQGRPAEAEREFRRLVADAPGYAEGRYNFALLLVAAERFAEAETELRAALRADPNFADAHNNLGNLLAMRGDRAGAEASFRRALAANPKLAEAHFNLGVALASAERLGEAQASFERALSLRQDYPEARLNLAVTLASQGRPVEARSHLEALREAREPRIREIAQTLLQQLGGR